MCIRKKAFQLGLTIICICCFLPNIKGQNYLRIIQKDGKFIEIAITDIRKLTLTNIASIAPEQKANVTGALLKFKTYPNPATDYVNINYFLTSEGTVTIEVYNLNGVLIFKSSQGNQNIGEYCYKWITRFSPSGTYLCRIRQNNILVTEKIILNK